MMDTCYMPGKDISSAKNEVLNYFDMAALAKDGETSFSV
jgi:hypothetical protein